MMQALDAQIASMSPLEVLGWICLLAGLAAGVFVLLWDEDYSILPKRTGRWRPGLVSRIADTVVYRFAAWCRRHVWDEAKQARRQQRYESRSQWDWQERSTAESRLSENPTGRPLAGARSQSRQQEGDVLTAGSVAWFDSRPTLTTPTPATAHGSVAAVANRVGPSGGDSAPPAPAATLITPTLLRQAAITEQDRRRRAAGLAPPRHHGIVVPIGKGRS